MFWRVQAAWKDGVHVAFAGREEHLAKRDVERLLATWILKNLVMVPTQLGSRHPIFVYEANMLRGSLIRLLQAGEVWQAYDTFHQFYDRWENEFDYPLWMYIGTIIVEAPPGQGPNVRKPPLSEEDLPPPGARLTLDGARMSAAKRWKIWWTDFAGHRHPALFVREDEAMRHLENLLEMQAGKLDSHASIESVSTTDPERLRYADDGIQLVFEIERLLSANRIMEAYNAWRVFEDEWESVFDPIPLDMAVGTVRVETE